MAFFSIASLGLTAVGVGMSAASAAGAFNGKVDSWQPTMEERATAKRSKRLFKLGQELQRPLDELARADMKQLKSPAEFARQAGAATNQVMGQADPAIRAGLNQAAATSGGPGSGRFMAQLGTSGAALDSGLTEANARGRMGALQGYMGRSGQYLDRMTNDLNTGMGLMESGATNAANRQAARINAQVSNNMARNQAMGQLGGSLIGLGMGGMNFAGGMGAAGGVAGVAGAASPTAGGSAFQYLYGNGAMPSSIGGIRLG